MCLMWELLYGSKDLSANQRFALCGTGPGRPLKPASYHNSCTPTISSLFLVTMIAPMSPALVSPVSSQWEWYIHMREEGSAGPGPERSGTYRHGHRGAKDY